MTQSPDAPTAAGKARSEGFEAWRAAHPDLGAKLEALRQDTAALAAQRRAQRSRAKADAVAASAETSVRLGEPERRRIAEQAAAATERMRAEAWGHAAAIYMEILRVDPANDDAHFGLAESLRAEGDLAGAARHYSLAASFPRLGSNNGFFRSMMRMQMMPTPADPLLAEPTVLFRVADAPTEVWDEPRAPRMTVMPGGEFTMGSLESEPNRSPTETPHRVTLAYPLAVSTCDVTRGEFAAFVAATGYDAESHGDVQTFHNSAFGLDSGGSWRNPGFEQTEDEPVVCVNYYDSVAYAAWLSELTGHRYRLPSEAEWEYAVRGGTNSIHYWGETVGLGHAHCDGCNPGEPQHYTLAGGQFPPNGFGLYDVVGNVWTWLADAWNPSYVGAPTDGSAWMEGVTALRCRRGGSWFNVSEVRPGDVRAAGRLRSAGRFGSLPHLRFSSFGLRVVREI